MLEIAFELDDELLLTFALFAASLSYIINEDFPRAIELAKINLKLCEEIEDQIGLSQPLIALGHASLARGDYQAARGYYRRCLKIGQETGFHYAIQTASKYLSKLALSEGESAEAQVYLLQSLTISKEIGFVRDIVNLLYEFARLRVAQGDLEGAVELLGLVIAHPASDHSRMLYGRIRDNARELLSEIQNDLAPEALNRSLKRGQNLDLDEVIDDLLATHSP
jgi:tetratricopeptide (TPR) repeat protein